MKNYNCPHINRPHFAHGLCKSCYATVRYAFDKTFRQKVRARQNRAQKRRYGSDDKYREDRKKEQVEYRKKHPDRYNYMMARHYFRKLSDKKRAELLDEVGYVKERYR